MGYRFLICAIGLSGLVQIGFAQQMLPAEDADSAVSSRQIHVRADTQPLPVRHLPSPLPVADSPRPVSSETVVQVDSARMRMVADSLRRDSLQKARLLIQNRERAYAQWLDAVWAHQQLFRHQTHPLLQVSPIRPRHMMAEQEDDWLFYLCVGYLFFLGFIRSGFYSYFKHVFQAFLHPALATRKLRDQLMQMPFPALLMNIFFAISMGLYLFLVLRYVHYTTQHQIYLLVLALSALIGCIYLVKYFILQFSGWIFGARELTGGYAFVLMLINKVLGVTLVPFVLLLAFGTGWVQDMALRLSWLWIAALFIYRYVRSYALVRQYMVFSRFHFFLYLCAFEVAPVLIMAKIILEWLHGGF